MQSVLDRLLYSIYKWWEYGRKRLIELPKIPLGNWEQPPIVSNPNWVLSVLIDVFPVTHSVSLETFLPSHNLFHFRFCPRVVYEIRPGNAGWLHWALLTYSPKYPCLFAEHLKRLESVCVCAIENLFYRTFALKCFSRKKRKLFSGTLPSFFLWDCSIEWLEYHCS